MNLARPQFQLRMLPLRMRWEVTRRHPEYFINWALARAEHRGEISETEIDNVLRQAAIVKLGMIGVSGEPPDPATPFDDLGSDELELGWLSVAVHPLTTRGMAAILLAVLPKETLGKLGMVFLTAACDDKENQPPPGRRGNGRRRSPRTDISDRAARMR